MRTFLLIITGFLKIVRRNIKSLAHFFLPYIFTSSAYSRIDDSHVADESKRLSCTWQSSQIPFKQRRIVDRQLIRYRSGYSNNTFDSVVDAVIIAGKSLDDKCKVLEVGCSSGYYSEVFEISGLDIEYTGVDYSQAFIDMARQYYPDKKFEKQDACALNFSDKSFDLVVSGCCLLHIPDYEKAIVESIRVSSKNVIFHRTPILFEEETTYYRKYAYGLETIEIHFNEKYFLDLLIKYGLQVIKTYTLNEFHSSNCDGATKTYLCEKIPR